METNAAIAQGQGGVIGDGSGTAVRPIAGQADAGYKPALGMQALRLPTIRELAVNNF
jgi:hypothetical protein